ncbi:MAG: hypothetical protein JRN52_01970 [Nitrososphaerota archaeon]|nr:hypothetical protein [Nitrososphaerota archaeon]
MVSETDVSTESTEEETGAMEEAPSYGAEAAPAEAPKVEAKPKPKAGGRRAALRIIREGVDAVSKDVASLKKAHDAHDKKLEKQISALKSEVASLKSHISKESAAARKREEAALARIFAKLSSKPKAAPKPKKTAKKGKSKK